MGAAQEAASGAGLGARGGGVLGQSGGGVWRWEAKLDNTGGEGKNIWTASPMCQPLNYTPLLPSRSVLVMPHEVGIIATPGLQTRKLRLRQANSPRAS